MPFKCLSLIVTLVGLLAANTSVHAQKCLLPGFKVELIFGTEQIEHPSVVTCDDRGNLFVGEDPMDMRGPTTEEFDRVLFVQFNPDGSVKKKTIFAGLSGLIDLLTIVCYVNVKTTITIYICHCNPSTVSGIFKTI